MINFSIISPELSIGNQLLGQDHRILNCVTRLAQWIQVLSHFCKPHQSCLNIHYLIAV